VYAIGQSTMNWTNELQSQCNRTHMQSHSQSQSDKSYWRDTCSRAHRPGIRFISGLLEDRTQPD
jgi:hypothetical protein